MTSHLKLVHSVATVKASPVQAKVKTKAQTTPALAVSPTPKKKAPARKKAQPTPQELITQNVRSFDINVDEVLHLTGDSDGINLNNDPIVSSGSAEMNLRRLIAHYGFHRLPLTYGEFHGLLDYCDILDIAFGQLDVTPDVRSRWQPYSIDVVCEAHPEMAQAVKLYCKGDKEVLAQLHKKADTLTNLGINYVPEGTEA